jgi:hypothetical protein
MNCAFDIYQSDVLALPDRIQRAQFLRKKIANIPELSGIRNADRFFRDTYPSHCECAPLFVGQIANEPVVIKVGTAASLAKEVDAIERVASSLSRQNFESSDQISLQVPSILSAVPIPEHTGHALVMRLQGVRTLEGLRSENNCKAIFELLGKIGSQALSADVVHPSLVLRNVVITRHTENFILVDWERGMLTRTEAKDDPRFFFRCLQMIEETSILGFVGTTYWSKSWPSFFDLFAQKPHIASMSSVKYKDLSDPRVDLLCAQCELSSIATDRTVARLYFLLSLLSERSCSLISNLYAADVLEIMGFLDLRVRFNVAFWYAWYRNDHKFLRKLTFLLHETCLQLTNAVASLDQAIKTDHLEALNAVILSFDQLVQSAAGSWAQVFSKCQNWLLEESFPQTKTPKISTLISL